MKRIYIVIFTLIFLLALPGTVGAQDSSSQITMEQRIVRTFERYESRLKHESALWDYLDSLYRASREKKDTMWAHNLTWEKTDMAQYVRIPNTTIYIREITPLDSVPIVGNCWKIGAPRCDTTGWRITKERVTERREK